MIGAESDAELFSSTSASSRSRPWEPDEDATATINYTSGTTARPKGVQMTHRNLWLNATTFGWQTGVSDRDVYLHTLPMFHCNGWGMPFATCRHGRDPDRAAQGRRRARSCAGSTSTGSRCMCGAPAVVAAILDAAATWDGEIPGAGRTRIVVAGAPPPTRTIERVETELGWEFIQIYGLTETAPLLTMNRAAGGVGRPVGRRAGQEARAGPARRRSASASTVDDQGEVLARGNHVLEGYWEQPEATADAIVDGWFRTGDGGFLDDDGYLTILDRKKDVIISGGENVSSIEVEDALFSHPAVAEVAVIGVPAREVGRDGDGARGRLAPGAEVTEDELRDHCRTPAGRLQGADAGRVPRRAGPHGHRQAAEVQAARRPYWEGRERQVN